jgi:solute carrier family 13 (sodium-dependent dicarboxylate transporter), member 2/3/5
MTDHQDTHAGPHWIRWAGLFAGPLLAAIVHAALPHAVLDDAGKIVSGLSWEGRAAAAVGVLMIVWWLTEAIPLEATALLPIALFPILGVQGIKPAAAPYADDVIFLFMGGMFLGCAMEKWGLHRRIALRVIGLVGTRPVRVVGGFLLACALVSMWVSNTATAVMMLPVAVSVLTIARQAIESRGDADPRDTQRLQSFAGALLLAIAYGSTIGGIGTLIGTPPNIVLANFVSTRFQYDISFLRWAAMGVPLMLVFLPIAWFVLTRVAFRVTSEEIPGVRDEIDRNVGMLGRMSRGEWTVLGVFSAAAISWMLREPLGEALGIVRRLPDGRKIDLLTDSGIAVIASILLFMIPVDASRRVFALDWRTASRIPWGILLMFGGGLSLTAALTAHGVDLYIGEMLGGLGGMHPLLVILTVCFAVVFASEFAGNTALATAVMPIAAAVAIPLGVHPFLLVIPAAMASSYAFMMPMGTPPNAIVFAPGYLHVSQMARAGFLLNLAAIVLITLLAYFLIPLVFDLALITP